MREKKKYTILTFHTTTEAMAMERQCEMHQIPGRLIPVPVQITAGCGLAWRMLPDEYEEYREEIQSLALHFDEAVELDL